DADLDVLGALELDRRLLRRDADDRLDLRVLLERAREPAAPVAREAGDEDAHQASPTQRPPASTPSSSSRMPARISSAIGCTRPVSSHGASPRSSVRTGSRKRMRNLAGR